MRIIAAVVIFAAAAAGAALPGEFLVSSPKLVEASAEAGLWYLAESPAGHLYLAEGRALPALAPYRVLHDDPETSSYYLVYEYGAGEAARAAAPDAVQPLGDDVFLMATSRGRAVALAAAGARAEFVRLRPVRRVETAGTAPAEPAPAFREDVDAALETITENEVENYLTTLQNFETRFSYTDGYRDAAAWAYDFLDDLGYDTSYDEFLGVGFVGVSVPTDGSRAWVVSDGGTIYHTADGGENWEQQNAPAARGALWSVQFLSDQLGYTVGESGTCLKTSNGGETWTGQTVPYDGYLFGVGFVDADTGWVAADEGRILHTSNGGSSWAEQTTPVTDRLYDVAMADATHGWACGREGVILRTEDGETWTVQNSHTTTRLYGIYAVSADEAWCCGWSKTLLHTTDGGENWNFVDLPQPTWAYFYDVRFGDANHGYVVGLEGAFLSSDDGGATWDYQSLGEDDFYGCDFAAGTFGFIGGSAALYRTENGGGSFESLIDNFDDKWLNVVGEKRGYRFPDEIVIVCGHMDSISEMPLVSAPGADDNASGTVATLAAARALAGMDFERTLRFICWCGEEEGLLGSHHYAANAAAADENILAVVNFDMVAYDEEQGSRDDTSNFANETSAWLGEYLVACGELYGINHEFDFIVDPSAGSSDHASFWAYGYDAILLIEGESGVGGVIEYPYYHTTQDTVDKLTMKLQLDNARVAAATAAHLARASLRPDGVAAPGPGAGAEELTVYPNPFRTSSGPGHVRFAGLSEGSTVEIYDLSGHLIFKADNVGSDGHYDWPVTSSDGEAAASGIYVYRVSGGDKDEAGKLAIIR
ncbi:MAG: M20/M25/M40 family metallo-hydrolase [Candidatus Zixiibacteriota bacterium]|jgi:photosystem II stability/assembly factor-like uncharacterized protein